MGESAGGFGGARTSGQGGAGGAKAGREENWGGGPEHEQWTWTLNRPNAPSEVFP